MIDDLKKKMERDGLSIYAVAKSIGVTWITVKSWLDGRKKPRGLSEKAIREFLSEKA